jgi:hypothetical protein
MMSLAPMIRLLAMAYDWLLRRLGFLGDFARLTFDENHVGILAVALQRTSQCTTHAGVAYRTTAGVIRFLHFANHESLRDETNFGPCAFAIPLMKEEDLEYLAEFCARVFRANQKGKLPYSFEFDMNLGFDRNSGLVIINHNSGLTCSTFVVALFRSAGNPLVIPITWPRRADAAGIAARRYLLNYWRQTGKQKYISRADVIEPTIQTMRISPEEVAGACLQKKVPIGYFRAWENGRSILRRIDTVLGPAPP